MYPSGSRHEQVVHERACPAGPPRNPSPQHRSRPSIRHHGPSLAGDPAQAIRDSRRRDHGLEHVAPLAHCGDRSGRPFAGTMPGRMPRRAPPGRRHRPGRPPPASPPSPGAPARRPLRTGSRSTAGSRSRWPLLARPSARRRARRPPGSRRVPAHRRGCRASTDAPARAPRGTTHRLRGTPRPNRSGASRPAPRQSSVKSSGSW